MFKICRSLLCLMLFVTGTVIHADETAQPLTADELLARLRLAMPQQPMSLNGRLQSKDKLGREEEKYNIDILWHWAPPTPTARYRIMDAFGRPLEELAVTWDETGQAKREYTKGPDHEPATPPPTDATVQQTDFTWGDLSLDFLWWPNGTIAGHEKKKTRHCTIVDIPAPPQNTQTCAGIRLWIDPEINMLLQADVYGPDEKLLRRMAVKSFKRVNGEYTLQDVNIYTYPSRHKTMLKIGSVRTLKN
jgi:hypothetical protein